MSLPDRERRRAITGAAISLVMLAIAVLILSLRRVVDATRGSYQIVGVFHETPRLRAGSTVGLAGYDVGLVTGIILLPPGRDSLPVFAATLRIPKRYQDEIRRDSQIRLVRRRPLSEPNIEISPGTPGSPPLVQGDTLWARPPLHPRTLLTELHTLNLSLGRLISEGREFSAGSGDLIRPWSELSDRAETILVEFQLLRYQFSSSHPGALIADSAWRPSLDRIIGMADEIVLEIRARAATAGTVLGEFSELDRRVAETAAQIEALRSVVESAMEGGIGRWRSDPAIRNAIETTHAHLDSLIELTRREPWRYFF